MITGRIDVTQKHIDDANASGVQGARCKPLLCPITRAAEEKFGVGCATLRDVIYVGDDEHRIALPQVARDFVWHYDMGHAVAPFSFDVDASCLMTPPTPRAVDAKQGFG